MRIDNNKSMKKKHNCWGGLDGIYKWIPRTENPKSCPRCKRRFDYPLIIEEENKMKKTEEYLNKEKLFRNIRGDRK